MRSVCALCAVYCVPRVVCVVCCVLFCACLRLVVSCHAHIHSHAWLQALGCILYTMAFYTQPFQEGGNLQIISGKCDAWAWACECDGWTCACAAHGHVRQRRRCSRHVATLMHVLVIAFHSFSRLCVFLFLPSLGNYEVPEVHPFSKYLTALIKRLLTVHPKKRPDTAAVLELCAQWEKWLASGKPVAKKVEKKEGTETMTTTRRASQEKDIKQEKPKVKSKHKATTSQNAGK